MKPRIGRVTFCWLPRTEGMTFADDPRYEPDTHIALLAAVAREAEASGLELKAGDPEPSFVRKPRNADVYMPCGPFTDGAIPAWMWYGTSL